MQRIFRMKAHEAKHGPHFDEAKARKAVSNMENEDGTMGPHWSLDETTSLATQYGVKLEEHFNKYDWYVALNMVYSDYYKVITSIANQNNTKHFVDFAKAWLHDKDVEKGKMWYYYTYVMCYDLRDIIHELYEREHEEEEEEEEALPYRSVMRRSHFGKRHHEYDDDYEMQPKRSKSTRYVRY